MFAEVITIGDELLIGQVVDTNSAWMGQELNKIGIEVLRIVSIRDREEEIMEAVNNAMKRVNIVLVTGGLGPTKDDITKQTLCKYFHTELIFSEEVFENFIAKLEDLKEKIGIKKTIKDYGIDEKYFLDTLDDMCEQAFNDQCTGANPRYPLMKEIKEIYLKCYYGK